MFESIKDFSIADVQMYNQQGEDLDFSKVEIWALAEGTNSHRNPFSREILERDANTFKGKFIVAKFDKYMQDCQGHELDEAIIGYVDPTEEIEFKLKEVDGIEKEFVVVKGLISKIYATDIVDMFRMQNGRSVSCEFSCSMEYEENEYGRPIDEFGVVMDVENLILKYHIHGITVLGLSVNPSVKGTEIKVKQFAEKFNKINLKELAQQRTKMLASDNNEVISKQEKLEYKDDNIKDKEDKMEDEKKLSQSEIDKEEKDVVMEEQEQLAEVEMSEEVEMAEDEKEMSEEVEMSEDKATEETDKEVEMSEEVEMAEDGDGCLESKEMAEDDSESKDDEDKEDDKEQEKKFSLDAFVDSACVLSMLEKETEVNRELAQRVVKEMSAIEIVETIISLNKENLELKKFQEDRLNYDKEMKLNSIMASVKEDLDTKTFSELQKEGETIAFDQLDGFANKVKAFAYEATKKIKMSEKSDDIMIFASSEDVDLQNKSEQDVFERISRM